MFFAARWLQKSTGGAFRTPFAVALIALSGCVATEPAPKATADVPKTAAKDAKVPPEVTKFAMDLAMAVMILARCGNGLKPNDQYLQGMSLAFEKKYGKEAPWSEADMSKQLNDRYIQDYVLGYVKRRGVLMSQPQSWCAAGRADIAENTAIGKFLVAG